MLSALVVVAGILRFAPRDRPDDGDSFSATDGGALVSNGAPGPDVTARDAPVQAMRSFPGLRSFGDPSASVEYAKGHSPLRSVDGLEDTWFESAAPARAGDRISFRFATPLERSAEPGRGRRIEILLGRPSSSSSPFTPPCRVECSADPSGAPDSWRHAGDVDPSTGRYALDLEDLPISSVEVIRIVVTADSDIPLTVREARITITEAE